MSNSESDPSFMAAALEGSDSTQPTIEKETPLIIKIETTQYEPLVKNESGRIEMPLDELSDGQYNTLLAEIQAKIDAHIAVEREYESAMSPQTLDRPEKVDANKVHMAVVRDLVVKFAAEERGLLYVVDTETGDLLPGSQAVGNSERTRPLLPVETIVRRQAEIAAVLHDIDKHKKFQDEPSRLLWHHLWSAETADVILSQVGVSPEDTSAIVQVIEEHQAMPFVADRLTDAKNGHPFWSRGGSPVISDSVTTLADIERAYSTFKTSYDKDLADVMLELEALSPDASPEQKLAFDNKFYDVQARGQMLERMTERDFRNTVLPSSELGMTREDFLSPTENKIVEVWEKGKYSYPTTEASALLFAADLSSPARVINQELIQIAADNNITELKDMMKHSEVSDFNIGAGSFDRYVSINLGWGNSLEDSFDIAYSSLQANVESLSKIGTELLNTRTGNSEHDQKLQRTGAILHVEASGYPSSALNDIGHWIKDDLYHEILMRKYAENKGEVPPILTSYAHDLELNSLVEAERKKLKSNELEFTDAQYNDVDIDALKTKLESQREEYTKLSLDMLYTVSFRQLVEKERRLRSLNETSPSRS